MSEIKTRGQRTFYLHWTYIANYSERPIEIEAGTPEGALAMLLDLYSADFRRKATVRVFDVEPLLVYDGHKVEAEAEAQAGLAEVCLCGHTRAAHIGGFARCNSCRGWRIGAREVGSFVCRPGLCDRFSWAGAVPVEVKQEVKA